MKTRVVVVRCEIESSGTDAEVVAVVERLVVSALKPDTTVPMNFSIGVEYGELEP